MSSVTEMQLCGSRFTTTGVSSSSPASMLLSASADGTIKSTTVRFDSLENELAHDCIIKHPATITSLDVDHDSRYAMGTSVLGGLWTFSVCK
jgi:hypothetical protein